MPACSTHGRTGQADGLVAVGVLRDAAGCEQPPGRPKREIRIRSVPGEIVKGLAADPNAV